MPFDSQSYQPMPLLVVSFSGRVTLADFHAVYDVCVQSLQNHNTAQMWRILDFGDAEMDFSTVMDVVKDTRANAPGQFTDERFVNVLIGTHNMGRLLSDLCTKQDNGGASFTVMPGLGEALLYAQDEIAAGTASTGG